MIFFPKNPNLKKSFCEGGGEGGRWPRRTGLRVCRSLDMCSQACFYTKCLSLKKGNNSTENGRTKFKSKPVHLHPSPNLHAISKDPCLCGSLDMLFTSYFLYKMPVSEKGE